MSYNYDMNPWDDNYTTNQSNTASGGYAPSSQQGYGVDPNSAAGQYSQNSFANPYETQYSYGGSPSQQQQYDDAEVGQVEPAAKPVDGTDGTGNPSASQSSFVGRFLRQHVPLCGSIFDTLSGINLPFIDALLQHINRDLLVSKVFYFFFYSAFGSLFPLMGVYFKQLGMNPAQVGILTGVRPFIEIFSAPFWNSLASRFQKSKALLLFSLLSWIVFTYSLAHIRPPASACVAFNDTDYVLYTPYSANDLSNYETSPAESSAEESVNKTALLTPGVKDEILVKEENQNDQGRRRRRRRASDEGLGSFVDADSELLLPVDLESDFDDTRIDSSASSVQAAAAAGKEPQPDDDSLIDVERRRRRRRRNVSNAGLTDDLLGESDPESEQTGEDSSESSDDNATLDDTSSNNNSENNNYNANGVADNEEEVNGNGNNNDYTGVSESSQVDSSSLGDNKHNGQQQRHETYTATEQPAWMTKQQATTPTTTMTTTAKQESQLEQVSKTRRVFKQRHKTPPTHIVGMSPITVEYAVNYNKDKHKQFVTPMFSTIVYKLDDIKEVFFLLLLLISLGEFFSAPAITLADSATLSYLGDNVDHYGRQRMFGSLSWAITLLLVGMALDNATSIADHPCGPHQRERSYTVCFVIFSLLMACALMTATQFRFSYPKKVSNGGAPQAMAIATDTNGASGGSTGVIKTTLADGSPGNIDQLYASTQPRSIFNTAPPVNAPPSGAIGGAGSHGEGGGKEKFEYLDKWKSAVFAQRTRELPEWVNVFRQFQNSLHLMYLFITWFLGCGVGLVFTFLFWHLQDVGGTPTLFGICSVINHISEIMAYFFSSSVIKRVGHTRVLSVGLGCNVIRFIYVAFLSNPYYALPFELVQGITHAACFAACCSYMSHVSRPELKTSTQGVMQGLHHGIGRASGALLGGYAINTIGSRASFCIYGLLSGLVLSGFLYIRKRCVSLNGDGTDGAVIEPDAKLVDQSEAALGGFGAPQGVPSALPNTKIATTSEW